MPYYKITASDVAHLQTLVGSDAIKSDEESLMHYGHDETEDLVYKPDLVLLPTSTRQVQAIMRYCHEKKIAVTPIGARTGLSGGALSLFGGVGLCLEKMNNIVHLDLNNQQVTTQPGVITQVLQETMEAQGLSYPPDPSSRGSCFIGGNLAENAGGPRAVKYGVTKDWVLDLEVVLPNGDCIHTGAKTLKNSTGYNLTQLMVGSEGTLGIITEATLKLVPKPQHQLLMLAAFNDAQQACDAVSAIFRAGVTPSALEFMERDAIDWVLPFVPDHGLALSPEVQAHLLIEVDGQHLDALMSDCEVVHAVLQNYDCGEILFAEDQAQKNKLWALRRRVAEAVKSNSVYKEEDTVVPRHALAALLGHVKAVGKKYGFQSVCYGHAGDGNLHINIIRGALTDIQWHDELPKAITEIFEKCVALGGTLSGEHGIGLVQKNYMPIAFDPIQLQLMRSIKNIFDPHGILNPGKIFPDNG
jgi:glycolate oxidase